MKRSPAFLIVIIVLAAVRFAARGYFNTIMSLEQTGGLFFILAFGMILRWRMSMYSNTALSPFSTISKSRLQGSLWLTARKRCRRDPTKVE